MGPQALFPYKNINSQGETKGITMTDANVTAARIIGGVGTGKTQQLIEGVQAALKNGTPAQDILVVCATPQAALAFKERLAGACGTSSAALTVTNPRALALSVLADAEAIRWSGREPRILTAYEELFLMEDMKVTGLRPKRLREMLKFFYRSWTEMADDDESWLIGGEEEEVHSVLKNNLAFTRCVLEPEAANLAVNYLRTHAGALAAHGAKLVFVDDYQRLSRASQLLCGLLATEGITIAGDRNACVEVFDSYPYAAGLDEFMDTHTGASDVELNECKRCGASGAAAKALLSADENMTAVAFKANCQGKDAQSATILENSTPADEYAAITKTIQTALASGIAASSITVAVPNGVWARNLSSALNSANVASTTLNSRQPVRGDIRDNAKCLPAHVLTALDLVACPNNALAWRCWCGYNDWLANSSAINNLRKYASEHNLGLLDALRALESGANATGDGSLEHVVGAQRVLMNYQAGQAMIEAAAGLQGRELLNTLAAQVSNNEEAQAPGVVVSLCVEEGADNSAAAMAARFREKVLMPTSSNSEAVLIVPYDQVVGISPKLLIVAGFVNGFVPTQAYFDLAEMPLDKREKEHTKDTRRIYSLMGKADEQLVVSYFTKVPLEVAATLKLKIDRIRLENGARMCKISESIFGEYL